MAGPWRQSRSTVKHWRARPARIIFAGHGLLPPPLRSPRAVEGPQRLLAEPAARAMDRGGAGADRDRHASCSASSSIRARSARRASRSSSSIPGPPTAPTPRSRPSRRPTRPSATRARGRASAPAAAARPEPEQARYLSDARWMDAAIALGERGRGRTAPNPNVGCVIVRDGAVVGRGWTQPGGRPHAEAVALDASRRRRRGAPPSM